jgi:hypothetical protein
MAASKILLIGAAAFLVLGCTRTDRVTTKNDDDSARRWVEMYGNKTWEQVQQEHAERAADAARLDHMTSRLFSIPGDKNPWTNGSTPRPH